MPRNITITFNDGSSHRYENIPDSVTPDMIEARVNKDFPNKKITNIDGGKSANIQKSTIPITSQNSSNSNLSQFSIKGLRFGMSLNEVLAITKATEDDRSQKFDMKTLSYPTKPVSSEYDSLAGFSIGGTSGWHPVYKNGILSAIAKDIPSDSFDEWFEKLLSKYGKPKNLTANEVGNLMGYKTRNIEIYWDYQDVFIYLDRFNRNLTKGIISIEWKKWKDNLRKEKESEMAKNKKDFE